MITQNNVNAVYYHPKINQVMFIIEEKCFIHGEGVIKNRISRHDQYCWRYLNDKTELWNLFNNGWRWVGEFD